MAKIKTTGLLLKETLVVGAGLAPIDEFPAKMREEEHQTFEGKKLYRIPGLQALDIERGRPERNVSVSITDVENQAVLTPGVLFAPEGDAVVNPYSIDGNSGTAITCSRLVPVSDLERAATPAPARKGGE